MACKLLNKKTRNLTQPRQDKMKSECHQPSAYASAEFQLRNPGVFFQFKLRQSESEPMFALVKRESRALETIKTGDIIPVIYHFPDKTIPAEQKPTRIKYIADGSSLGFTDHCMVALEFQD